MSASRVSLREVAREAGVSPATASYALRHHAKIPAETRARVQAAAEALGYRPDALSRALVHRRWQERGRHYRETIAIVAESAPNEHLSYDKPPPETQSLAERLGYRLEFFNTHEYPPRRLARVMQARGVRGLILFQGKDAQPWCDFPWQEFSVVGCNQTFAHHPIDQVRPNPFDAVRICWRKAVEAGHRRIGLVLMGSERGITQLDERYVAGWLQQRQEAGRRYAKLPLLTLSSQPPAFPGEWLERHRPDCLIAMNDGIRVQLERTAWRVPHDVSLVMLNCSPTWDTSGCLNPFPEIWREALHLLDRKLCLNETGAKERPLSVVIPPIWRDGVTLCYREISA